MRKAFSVVAKVFIGLLLLLCIAVAVFYFGLRSQQPQMYEDPVSDNIASQIDWSGEKEATLSILVFSKTQGFRHHEAIDAAKTWFSTEATRNNWFIHYTENAADFSADVLKRFDVVVFSNTTKPHFSSQQQQALRNYIEEGGGYLGIHAAGDSSHHDWSWYRDTLIRATFTMHPLYPQFQTARLDVEAVGHPAATHLPLSLEMIDEWYSFSDNPREKGSTIFATLDENTYDPNFWSMGEDHPIIWSHELGKGRVFYSALGHRAEQFQDPRHTVMLEKALLWAAGRL